MPAPVDLIANSWDQLPKPCVSELGLVHAKGCQFLLADEVRPPQMQAGDLNIVYMGGHPHSSRRQPMRS